MVCTASLVAENTITVQTVPVVSLVQSDYVLVIMEIWEKVLGLDVSSYFLNCNVEIPGNM